MRSLFLISIAVFLTGCQTTEERVKSAQGAQALITPEVTKQCADAILEKNPKVNFEGPFFLGTPTGSEIFGTNDDIVFLAAPTSTVGAFNATYKHHLACSYEFRDNRLEFRKILVFRNVVKRKYG